MRPFASFVDSMSRNGNIELCAGRQMPPVLCEISLILGSCAAHFTARFEFVSPSHWAVHPHRLFFVLSFVAISKRNDWWLVSERRERVCESERRRQKWWWLSWEALKAFEKAFRRRNQQNGLKTLECITSEKVTDLFLLTEYFLASCFQEMWFDGPKVWTATGLVAKNQKNLFGNIWVPAWNDAESSLQAFEYLIREYLISENIRSSCCFFFAHMHKTKVQEGEKKRFVLFPSSLRLGSFVIRRLFYDPSVSLPPSSSNLFRIPARSSSRHCNLNSTNTIRC